MTIPAYNAVGGGLLHIIDFSPRLVHCSAGCRCIHNTRYNLKTHLNGQELFIVYCVTCVLFGSSYSYYGYEYIVKVRSSN